MGDGHRRGGRLCRELNTRQELQQACIYTLCWDRTLSTSLPTHGCWKKVLISLKLWKVQATGLGSDAQEHKRESLMGQSLRQLGYMSRLGCPDLLLLFTLLPEGL